MLTHVANYGNQIDILFWGVCKGRSSKGGTLVSSNHTL